MLTHPENASLLREAFRHVMEKHPFTIDAFVLLPDHLHCIWTMPKRDKALSERWRLICRVASYVLPVKKRNEY